VFEIRIQGVVLSGLLVVQLDTISIRTLLRWKIRYVRAQYSHDDSRIAKPPPWYLYSITLSACMFASAVLSQRAAAQGVLGRDNQSVYRKPV
jgi:hypothetical protein